MLHASRFRDAANGNGYSFAADTVESVREQAIRLPYGLGRGQRHAATGLRLIKVLAPNKLAG